MRKGADIRTYTADEIRAMRRRGEDRTDWAKVDAMTEADLERAIALDEDERDLEPTGRARSWSCPGPSNRSTCGSTPRSSSSSKPATRATSPACRRSFAPMSTPTNAGPGDRHRTGAEGGPGAARLAESELKCKNQRRMPVSFKGLVLNPLSLFGTLNVLVHPMECLLSPVFHTRIAMISERFKQRSPPCIPVCYGTVPTTEVKA